MDTVEAALFEQHLDECTLAEGAIALNALVYPDINQTAFLQSLDAMFEEVEQALVHEIDQKQKFESFLRFFYYNWRFQGDTERFFDSANSRMDLVLARRKGIPVSLGALLLYFGQRLGFPIEGVNFPSQFIIRINWYGEAPLFLNPFNGEYISKAILKAWLIGYDGPLAKLKSEHLAPCDNPSILGRWLAVMKGSLMHEDNFARALDCSNIALSFVPDDPYEIRDRGFIFEKLDCQQQAADDFQFFIDQCPEDPSSEVLKIHVGVLSSHTPVIH